MSQSTHWVISRVPLGQIQFRATVLLSSRSLLLDRRIYSVRSLELPNQNIPCILHEINRTGNCKLETCLDCCFKHARGDNVLRQMIQYEYLQTLIQVSAT